MSDQWEPCRLIDYGKDAGDPRYGLLLTEFDHHQELFEERGLMGGGYTWEGIVESLIRTHNPDVADHLEYDPESSMFCVRSSSLDALKVVTEWIRITNADVGVLEKALDNADPEILE